MTWICVTIPITQDEAVSLSRVVQPSLSDDPDNDGATIGDVHGMHLNTIVMREHMICTCGLLGPVVGQYNIASCLDSQKQRVYCDRGSLIFSGFRNSVDRKVGGSASRLLRSV